MENSIFTLIGIGMIYSVVHFFIIQHKRPWDNRTNYEKVLSVIAIVFISLVFLGTSQ